MFGHQLGGSVLTRLTVCRPERIAGISKYNHSWNNGADDFRRLVTCLLATQANSVVSFCFQWRTSWLHNMHESWTHDMSTRRVYENVDIFTWCQKKKKNFKNTRKNSTFCRGRFSADLHGGGVAYRVTGIFHIENYVRYVVWISLSEPRALHMIFPNASGSTAWRRDGLIRQRVSVEHRVRAKSTQKKRGTPAGIYLRVLYNRYAHERMLM